MAGILRRAGLRGMMTVVLLALMASSAAFASQESSDTSGEHPEFSEASLIGSYAFVGTYAANVAANLGVMTFDGLGTVKGSVLVNQPAADGSRTIVKVTVAGSYSVNRDGTGIILFTVILPNGQTAHVTEDFVITRSEWRNGVLIATSIFDAQEQPSVVISGNVFVTHIFTRRPD